MNKPLYDPQKGKMRVAGLVSGSGKGLLAIIERQKQLETKGDCNFEVVGLFSDNPKSKAAAKSRRTATQRMNGLRFMIPPFGRPGGTESDTSE